MITPIRGKVARVLNTREIAINVGTANGVTVGMYFDVIDSHYQDITDPDTNEMLGSIEYPKVRVKIIHVQEKLALATTYQKERVNIGGTGRGLPLGPFARALMPPTWVEKYDKLSQTEETKDLLKEGDGYVKIGDPVVQVIEANEEEQEDANRTSKVSNPLL